MNLDTEILDCIGKGLYASVYKAYVPSLDKVLAIKKLEDRDVDSIKRFEQEFKIMKSLDHQNLVSVYSYNEIKLEYIMDYIDFNLYQYISDNALDKNERLNLINQLLSGMEYLHNHNIMHRDLSLGNVMIKRASDDVILKITDFGLAKKEREYSITKTRTKTKNTIDDPALGSIKNFTPQNDIYAIGFIINYIYYSDLSIHSDDNELTKIVYKCMDLNLDNRYKNIAEIKTALRMVI